MTIDKAWEIIAEACVSEKDKEALKVIRGDNVASQIKYDRLFKRYCNLRTKVKGV
jgi:hypothetical protein